MRLTRNQTFFLIETGLVAVTGICFGMYQKYKRKESEAKRKAWEDQRDAELNERDYKEEIDNMSYRNSALEKEDRITAYSIMNEIYNRAVDADDIVELRDNLDELKIWLLRLDNPSDIEEIQARFETYRRNIKMKCERKRIEEERSFELSKIAKETEGFRDAMSTASSVANSLRGVINTVDSFRGGTGYAK